MTTGVGDFRESIRRIRYITLVGYMQSSNKLEVSGKG